ncbi:MAG: sodium-dependent transporter [Clostridia bacterium]|nr:sodium-dependent transporter [Clostridia bacterium]
MSQSSPSPKRENFASRLGFLLVSAGCAIGIGNVWRFPTVAGQNGGGVFVLFYLLFLLIMGVPVLTMELAVGRAGQGTASQAYKALEKKGSKWHLHGYVCLLGCVMLMMYYTTVSGWMLSYFVKFLTGTFNSLSASDAAANVFSQMLANPWEMGLFMAITVVLGILICSLGLQNGVERITKVMMCALILLIAVLAVHSFTLSGAKEGLSFFLLPDWSRASQQGIGQVIVSAMNQSFFTLSLGIGAMEIFGSYMSRENTLCSEAVHICALDTLVAISAGLIIFPACFSYGVSPDAGPSLIFITLPNVFTNMAGGQVWGTLFFLFMTFASFTTVVAVFENIIASVMELFHLNRRTACVVCGVGILLLSLPCVLGYNVWSGFQPKGAGSTVLDGEDFIVSNLLLPIGSLIYLLFCVTRWGWGFDHYLAEANTGKGIHLPRFLKPVFQFVIPLLIIVIIVQGLIG